MEKEVNDGLESGLSPQPLKIPESGLISGFLPLCTLYLHDHGENPVVATLQLKRDTYAK